MQNLRQLLAPYGELKPQPATDWTGNTALPTMVEEIYTQIGPHELMISTGGNSIYVPSLAKLSTLQVGYRTDGNTHERIINWPDEWLVIAAEGANPFIFNCKDSQIYFDFAGGGKWQPRLLAPNIATAFGSLATLSSALANLDDETDFEDFEMLPQAREKCIAALVNYMGDAQKAQIFVEIIEWYL